MKRFLTFGLAVLVSVSIPLQAQTAARQTGALNYDASYEVTVSGTVSGVLAKPASGMLLGSHLLLNTVSGPVDASLGRFGLLGKGAVSVAPGQQIEVTGVMKTIHDKQVFLTRSVKVGGEIFAVRNKHGVPMSPQSRERASGNTARKGESL
jgi:hypothetical protein